MKNLNSFANVERALEVERDRQIAVLEAGGRIAQVTLLFNAATGTTKPLRSKEESHDYRYFPDPDLPPLVLEPAWIEEQRATLPELPEAKRARFASAHGLPAYHAATLTLEQPVADFFEETVQGGGRAEGRGRLGPGDGAHGLQRERHLPGDPRARWRRSSRW